MEGGVVDGRGRRLQRQRQARAAQHRRHHVLGQVEVYRSGLARGGHAKGLMHDRTYLLNGADLIGPLGTRARQVDGQALLERIRAHRCRRHLPAQRDERR